MAEAYADPTNLLDDVYTSLVLPLLDEIQTIRRIRSPTREPMPAQVSTKVVCVFLTHG